MCLDFLFVCSPLLAWSVLFFQFAELFLYDPLLSGLLVTAEYGEALYLSFIFVVAKIPLPVLNHKDFCSFLSCEGFSFYLPDFSSAI